MSDATIHFTNSVRRWKRVLGEASGRVVICSPFITTPTAETVLAEAPHERVEIYTVFEALYFATGSSSIRTLRRLAELGCKLYHLPNLHAKIVLIPGEYVSVGSQNLTRQGTRNREAAAVTTDPRVLATAERDLERWLEERVEITSSMLVDMEALIRPLQRRFRELADSAVVVDQEMQRQAHARAVEFQKALKEEQDRHRQQQELHRLLAQLRSNVRAIKSVTGARNARVELKTTGYWGSSSTWSLSADWGDDWTRWYIDGRPVHLQRIKRYLTLVEGTGKLGWARIGQTRITFIAQSIDWTEYLVLGQFRCGVAFTAEWDTNKISEGNLWIDLTIPGAPGRLRIRAWFSINDLTILDMQNEAPGSGLVELARHVKGSALETRRALIGRLLQPFVYKHKLYGVEANQFFGPSGSRHSIRVANLHGWPMLIVSPR